MVESEERPFSRPNSRGLFRSTQRGKTKVRTVCWTIRSNSSATVYPVDNRRVAEDQKQKHNILRPRFRFTEYHSLKDLRLCRCV